MLLTVSILLLKLVSCSLYDNPDQDPLLTPPGPLGPIDADSHGRVNIQAEGSHAASIDHEWSKDFPFSGLGTFAHLDYARCLSEPDTKFDIAIVGAPYDTSVSYRPGARFGPRAIRQGSARQSTQRSFHPEARINPYTSPLRIIDCGDIPISPFSSETALRQMTRAFTELFQNKRLQTQPTNSQKDPLSKVTPFKSPPPKIVTLGGDHSITLAELRALSAAYNSTLAVLHLDAHLDTWDPRLAYPGGPGDGDEDEDEDDEVKTYTAKSKHDATTQAATLFTHGSMLWLAHREGLLRSGSLVHAGLRTRLQGPQDEASDTQQGWIRYAADSIDDVGGPKALADAIVKHIGTAAPVLLSLDVDVLDPSVAPGTGTPEAGGWTARELLGVLRGVQSLNLVAADVVEVSAPYDGRGEQTAVVAAQAVYEVVTSMVLRGVGERRDSNSDGDGLQT